MGSMLLLPLCLVLVTFIEEGLIVELYEALNGVSEQSASIEVLPGIVLFVLTGVLYFILVYAPLRAPHLIRRVRQQKPLAWLPGFLLEVNGLVLPLLLR